MRARDAERSSPTGNGAAQTSVAPAVEQRLDLRGDRGLVADDGGVGRPGGAAEVEDALVVRQHAVDGELLGGGRSGLGDVVVHGDGQAGDDARRRPPGLGRGR